MTMLFTNIVKGQITQSIIKTLFERAGYRVTRLGVEEVFDEIIHLDESQYRALNLPLTLRYLPDFLIAVQCLFIGKREAANPSLKASCFGGFRRLLLTAIMQVHGT